MSLTAKTLYFPDTSRRWSPLAPARSLGPESPAIWRDAINMISRDGKLVRRDGTVAADNQPSEINPALPETPVFLASTRSSETVVQVISAGSCANTYSDQGSSYVNILVTNRAVYLENSDTGGWTGPIAPTLTTGSITATNGSVNVTGAGTNWSTLRVSPYSFIKIDGTYFQICTVTNDTTLTLTSPFTGATGAGKAFEILRTWYGGRGVGEPQSLIFCQVYHNDVILAGSYLGRADGDREPCVVRITDVFGSTPVATYLTAKNDLTGSLDNISTMNSINGLQMLEDGRAVIATNLNDLRYSSLLDLTVWTASPAGLTTVVSRSMGIHALGRLGNSLTCHGPDGITLAHPTGRDDPPLQFQVTAAGEGCFCPRTLKSTGGAEFFVSADLSVHRFDGNSTAHVGEDVRAYLGSQLRYAARHSFFAAIDTWRGYYHLFDGGTAATTKMYTMNLQTGEWWRGQLPVYAGACSDMDLSSDLPEDGHLLLGIANQGWDGTQTDMVMRFAETAFNDEVVHTTPGLVETPTYLMESDDLDWGDPLSWKTPSRVIIWVKNQDLAGTTETIRVSLSGDGGSTWYDQDLALTGLSTTEEKYFQYSFIDEVPASIYFRVRIRYLNGDDVNRARSIVTRFLVEALEGGSILWEGV